jgi:hypothetical protein
MVRRWKRLAAAGAPVALVNRGQDGICHCAPKPPHTEDITEDITQDILGSRCASAAHRPASTRSK